MQAQSRLSKFLRWQVQTMVAFCWSLQLHGVPSSFSQNLPPNKVMPIILQNNVQEKKGNTYVQYHMESGGATTLLWKKGGVGCDVLQTQTWLVEYRRSHDCSSGSRSHGRKASWKVSWFNSIAGHSILKEFKISSEDKFQSMNSIENGWYIIFLRFFNSFLTYRWVIIGLYNTSH